MKDMMEQIQWTLRVGFLLLGLAAAWYFFSNGMQRQAFTTLGSAAVILAALFARPMLKPARGAPDVARSIEKAVRKVGARKDP